ncbi:MAG TPA: hypothetical protein GXX14_04755 [Clostridiaceae bacterium]|nr:hypothetical protein [Clostridiaceae bacterium]
MPYTRKLYIKVCIILVAVILLLPLTTFAQSDTAEVKVFADVPENHYAFDDIHSLRSLGIVSGMDNNMFGLGKPIKRSEFLKLLVSLMGWELINPEKGSFVDNMDRSKWYYQYIETALKHGVILADSDRFRPEEYITRQDMAVMIVRCLGYEELARQLTFLQSPFADVSEYKEHITIAKDLGIISGIGDNKFDPMGNALREHAAAMMMRMYNRLNRPLNEIHAFYAIKSYPQLYVMDKLDSVSFGWSCLQFDTDAQKVVLNTTANKYAFTIPQGFSEPVTLAKDKGVSTQLMVFASESDKFYDEKNNTNVGLISFIFNNPEIRKQVIGDIIAQVKSTEKDGEIVSFDGVVIDFEEMKGETLKTGFNTFLKELRLEMDKNNIKKLYVTVHPKLKGGQSYYDAYDYRTIGEIADRVILMAHDYNAKKLSQSEMDSGYFYTPLTPFVDVYYALKEITDSKTGVADVSKVWLQLSFDSAQWEIKDGRIINSTSYSPDYGKIRDRILNEDGMKDVTVNYSQRYENPYITYSNDEGSSFIIWYEDSRSVLAKIKLAKMFNIKGISLWRIGTIPDYGENDEAANYLNVWQKVVEAAGKRD